MVLDFLSNLILVKKDSRESNKKCQAKFKPLKNLEKSNDSGIKNCEIKPFPRTRQLFRFHLIFLDFLFERLNFHTSSFQQFIL